MAEFLSAYRKVMGHEGGYSNDPSDRGGQTYMGIARNANPTWRGWQIVENNLPLDHGEIIRDDALNYLVKTFYKSNYWDKISGDLIADQHVAEFIFDFYVNSGNHAVKSAQKVLGLVQDGSFGPKTLRALNDYPGTDLLAKLKADRVDFVYGIVRRNPTQRKFLKGWLNRIQSF